MSNQLFVEVGRRPSPWRRGARALIYLILAATVVCIGLSAYAGWKLTHPAGSPISLDPASAGLDAKDVSFESVDGIPLSGWFIPASGGRSDRTVIFAHGYAGNRHGDEPAVPMAQAVTESGFNALLFDFRNSGESGGSLTTVGAAEVQDVSGAIRFLQDAQVWDGRLPGEGVALVGFSMGAVASILAAGGEPGVRAVVADSPFADMQSYLGENLSQWTNLPAFPFNSIILWMMPVLTRMEMDAVRPVDVVAGWGERPLLLIHGTDDEMIPISNSEKLLRAAPHGANVSLWRVPGAGHVGAYTQNPDGYRARVISLLQRALPEERDEAEAEGDQPQAHPLGQGEAEGDRRSDSEELD